MTISSSVRTAGPFVGTGLNTAFPFTFKVFQTSDLLVARTDTGLVQTTLVLSVDYTVSLNVSQNVSPGGTVTLLTPLPAGYTLTLTSNVPALQPLSLTNGGGFFPANIEDELDRLTILQQQLGFNVSQALRVPEIGGVPAIPAALARASQLLGFDASGNPITVAPTSGSAAALATDLTNSVLATKGAGQVGFGYGVAYGVGTIGKWLNDLATSAGSSLIGFIQAGTGAVLRTMQVKVRERVSVKDFGAVGDFNPATGVGTDDRAAIQAAFDYAISVTGGCEVVFPPGRYYGGAAAGAYAGATAIVLGNTSAGSAVNVSVRGYGAELYQGNVGRFVGIFGADRVWWRGLKMFGYTGGSLGSTRQNDALLTINYSSRNVQVRECYFTNGLGDQIYIGGTLVAGGGTGSEARNIEIAHNVVKTRWGNGTSSFTGGTTSRTCIAAVDTVGLNIHNNDLYGTVDLEPNLDGQHVVGVQIHDNKFKSGFVTPQSSIGTAYWFDEPIGLSGGTEIPQALTITGVPGAPVVSGNNVRNNVFENGYISDYNVYVFDRVDGNVFQKGQIRVGSTSGTNDTSGRAITRNRAIAPLSGETCFIRLDGRLQVSEISGNDAGSAFTYVINNPAGGSTGDLGRLRILNNTLQNSGTKVNNVTLLGTSVEFGSVATVGSFNAATANSMQVTDLGSPHTSVPISGTNLVINWLTYRSSNWRTSQAAAAADSIAQITNPQYDGQELTINCGSSGGGSLTLIHNASFIRCKGAANAVLSGENIITFQARAGIWFEKSRSF